MAVIIDGKLVSAKIREEIRAEVDRIKAAGGRVPGLAVVIVGDDPASKVYIKNKKIACEQVGFLSEEYALPKETSMAELEALVDRLNAKPDIDGILYQSPMPSHIDLPKLFSRISPDKDVDAFNPYNVGKIMTGNPKFPPCTPAGVMELLKYYKIDPAGKHCVIIGRSNIVGKPQAMLMLHADATVTVCHSKTLDLAEQTRRADIIVCAVGRRGTLTGDMVKTGAVVIDVGMNKKEDGKLCGDADFDSVSQIASYITPVPGGVGPMTITMLMKNTLTAYKANIK